jgi:hypothetical protein
MNWKVIVFSISRIEVSRPRIVMARIGRQFLSAFLIACHSTVTLCGPCLHELPNAAHHHIGAASKLHRADDPLRPRSDSKEGCLICQFVAQGQLPVESSGESSPQLVAELVLIALAALEPLSYPLASGSHRLRQEIEGVREVALAGPVSINQKSRTIKINAFAVICCEIVWESEIVWETEFERPGP